MLLSSWYTKWKEKQIREAAEAARKQGYEEGYKAGKSETRKETDATNAAQISEEKPLPPQPRHQSFPKEKS